MNTVNQLEAGFWDLLEAFQTVSVELARFKDTSQVVDASMKLALDLTRSSAAFIPLRDDRGQQQVFSRSTDRTHELDPAEIESMAASVTAPGPVPNTMETSWISFADGRAPLPPSAGAGRLAVRALRPDQARRLLPPAPPAAGDRALAQPGGAEIWRAFAPTVLSRVTVTATLSSTVSGLMTVMSFKGVDISGANGSGAIGAVASAGALLLRGQLALLVTQIIQERGYTQRHAAAVTGLAQPDVSAFCVQRHNQFDAQLASLLDHEVELLAFQQSDRQREIE